ncbi:MAG: hypothetical protein IJP92_11475, partial [Lachnospiraceae bacterium]|nr:hypothetical protein [Lachnospiraceae bacterium]
RDMVTLYGMSDKFGLMQLETIRSRYLDGIREMNCSDETAAQVDEEVRQYLEDCYNEAKQIISDHLDAMDRLAQYLIENETITGKEFMRIFREVEGLPEPEEEEEGEEGEKKMPRRRIRTRREESAMVGEDVPVRDGGKTYKPDTSSWKKQVRRPEGNKRLHGEDAEMSKEPPVQQTAAAEETDFRHSFEAEVRDDKVSVNTHYDMEVKAPEAQNVIYMGGPVAEPADTPHQSPAGTASPGGEAMVQSLPLEGKVAAPQALTDEVSSEPQLSAMDRLRAMVDRLPETPVAPETPATSEIPATPATPGTGDKPEHDE